MWGGDDTKKKIHWVPWSKVIAYKKDGGLGVGSLKAQNLVVITKWLWRLKSNTEAIWNKCIVSIHNLFRKPLWYLAKKTISGVWTNIAKAIKTLPDTQIDHQSLFSVVPGSNVQAMFWLDRWCGSETLKNMYPLLYELESVKRCFITERISDSSFTWRWKSALSGDNLLSKFLQLCSTLNNIRIKPDALGIRFNLNNDGVYTVNTLRKKKLTLWRVHTMAC